MYPKQSPYVILPAEPPPIRTFRTLLRPLHSGYAPDIFKFRSLRQVSDWLWPKSPDPDLNRTQQWIEGKIFTTPDAVGIIGRSFSFVVILQVEDQTETVIGHVGINALDPAPSIAYAVHPKFWGKGYATEAVQAVVQALWALWALPRVRVKDTNIDATETATTIDKLYAACNKANVGSCHVLAKNGFRIYTEVPLEGDIVAFFELNNPSLGVMK